jgi:hypothetical protein
MKLLESLVIMTVLALTFTTAHAEKLLFQDRNAIQDWWFSDENADGSLTLSTKSNDPSVMPFYLICKGRPAQYSILFQPAVSPVNSVYHYRVFDLLRGNFNRSPDIITPANKNGDAEPVNISGDAAAWFLYSPNPFKINYQLADGSLGNGHYYVPPPPNAARLFATRCVNLGIERQAPPSLTNNGLPESRLSPKPQAADNSKAECEADWHACTKNGLNDLLFNKKGRAIRAACVKEAKIPVQQGADYFDMRDGAAEFEFLKTGIVEVKDYSWQLSCSYNLNTNQVSVKSSHQMLR